VNNIRSIVGEIVVVIGFRDNPEKYEIFLPLEVNTFKDQVFGKGPLMGILSGMRKMNSKYALISTCDSPFSKRELINYLITRAKGVDAVIPVWPNGNSEPLHAIYRISSAMPAAESAVNNDELLVLDMVKRLDKVVYVGTETLKEFDQDLVTFFNINDSGDMIIAEKLYREEMLSS
jgi:molybdopterin-guanine dinucleotide biosynthesis protein A